MNIKSWNLQRKTEKNQGKLHVRCLTARLIHEPETSRIQKKKVTTFAVDLHSKLVNRVPCFVWCYIVEHSAINSTLCPQGSYFWPACGMTYQTSIGCPSLLGNSGKSHVFIPQVERTVATLFPAREKEASAFCWRHNEILLSVESTKCTSGLFFMRNFWRNFLQATCASGTSDMRDPRCGRHWSNISSFIPLLGNIMA
jgi:hypothetical protein